MTAMTCSRVTPAFTVMMTITPVVAGEAACAWARDGWVMQVAPIRVRVSPKAMLRIAFIGLVSPIMAVTFVFEIARMSRMLGLDISGAPDLQVGCKAAVLERLFAIMLMGYEAELHSQAGCARRRGGVPERCPAPQLSPSSRGARGDAIGDQSGGTRAGDARRCSALPAHDAQCRPDRSRRTVPFARKARLRGARRRKRGCARSWAATDRAVAPHCAAGSGADPAGAADRILLPSLSRGRGGDRRKRGTGRPRGRRV